MFSGRKGPTRAERADAYVGMKLDLIATLESLDQGIRQFTNRTATSKAAPESDLSDNSGTLQGLLDETHRSLADETLDCWTVRRWRACGHMKIILQLSSASTVLRCHRPIPGSSTLDIGSSSGG